MIKVRIGERGELVAQLSKQLEVLGITDAMVSIVGAVRSATLATMKADDPKTTVYSEHRFAEVSGNGEIEDGVPNLHVTLGLEGGHAFSGHLHEATVGGPYFVMVYVVEIDLP